MNDPKGVGGAITDQAIETGSSLAVTSMTGGTLSTSAPRWHFDV
jgi:hypothetical protein